MRTLAASGVVMVAAFVSVSVLLLAYGGDRNDPVGRLSPIANPTPRTVKTRPTRPPAKANTHTDVSNSDD